MSGTLIFIIVGIIVVAIILLLMLFMMGGIPGSTASQNKAVSSNLRNLVTAQRTRREAEQRGQAGPSHDKTNLALVAAAEGDITRKKSVSTSRMTLDKKLRYSRWPITPFQYRAIQVFLCIAFVIPAYLLATVYIVIVAAFAGPIIVKELLDATIRKRVDNFDKDYPVLLLSYVSLLKTGMSVIQGLEAAARGLDEDSFVRSEVELLIERLRLGLTEDQAIGAFGEDVAHPEIELFVQSLILSKRVGGTLSATLERLAKQVRKRQQFRKQAVAAVGMERASLAVIACIMTLLMLYLMWTSPQLIFPAFQHPLGQKITQGGLMLIIFGFYLSRKVTELKI